MGYWQRITRDIKRRIPKGSHWLDQHHNVVEVIAHRPSGQIAVRDITADDTLSSVQSVRADAFYTKGVTPKAKRIFDLLERFPARH